jgi:hypothetical protein
MKEIIVEINASGECSVEGKGFSGPECTKFLNEVTDCLGSVENRTKKQEYNDKVKAKNHIRTRGR